MSKEVIKLLEEQIKHEFGLFQSEDAKQRLSKDWVNGYERGVEWLLMRVERLLKPEPICKTCNDTGSVWITRFRDDEPDEAAPCPDCKPELTGEAAELDIKPLSVMKADGGQWVPIADFKHLKIIIQQFQAQVKELQKDIEVIVKKKDGIIDGLNQRLNDIGGQC